MSMADTPEPRFERFRLEYRGHRYLDIRVYTEIEGKADKVPTKKGVTCGRT